MPNSLTTPVIEIHMGHLKAAGEIVQRVIVVLAGDLYGSRFQILHRMIASVMTELQASAFCSACEPQKLMPEANPHQRNFPEQIADIFSSISDSPRIGGPVRKPGRPGSDAPDSGHTSWRR